MYIVYKCWYIVYITILYIIYTECLCLSCKVIFNWYCVGILNFDSCLKRGLEFFLLASETTFRLDLSLQGKRKIENLLMYKNHNMKEVKYDWHVNG